MTHEDDYKQAKTLETAIGAKAAYRDKLLKRAGEHAREAVRLRKLAEHMNERIADSKRRLEEIKAARL